MGGTGGMGAAPGGGWGQPGGGLPGGTPGGGLGGGMGSWRSQLPTTREGWQAAIGDWRAKMAPPPGAPPAPAQLPANIPPAETPPPVTPPPATPPPPINTAAPNSPMPGRQPDGSWVPLPTIQPGQPYTPWDAPAEDANNHGHGYMLPPQWTADLANANAAWMGNMPDQTTAAGREALSGWAQQAPRPPAGVSGANGWPSGPIYTQGLLYDRSLL